MKTDITFLDTIDTALIAIIIALAVALIKVVIDFRKSQKENNYKANIINAFYILALVYAISLQYSASTERALLKLEINNKNRAIEIATENKLKLEEDLAKEISLLKKSFSKLESTCCK